MLDAMYEKKRSQWVRGQDETWEKQKQILSVMGMK